MLSEPSRAAVPRSDSRIEVGEKNAVQAAARSTRRMTATAQRGARHSDHADIALFIRHLPQCQTVRYRATTGVADHEGLSVTRRGARQYITRLMLSRGNGWC